jgi:hypothetical protein
MHVTPAASANASECFGAWSAFVDYNFLGAAADGQTTIRALLEVMVEVVVVVVVGG